MFQNFVDTFNSDDEISVILFHNLLHNEDTESTVIFILTSRYTVSVRERDTLCNDELVSLNLSLSTR